MPTEYKANYTVNDRRGESKEPLELPCRVCGSPTEHSKDYNKPTMDCIKYLRDKVSALQQK